MGNRAKSDLDDIPAPLVRETSLQAYDDCEPPDTSISDELLEREDLNWRLHWKGSLPLAERNAQSTTWDYRIARAEGRAGEWDRQPVMGAGIDRGYSTFSSADELYDRFSVHWGREEDPRDRTAKGRPGSKATGKAPRTAAGGADAKVGNVPAPVAEREAVREAEPVSLPDEAVAAPVSDVRKVASNGTRAEGRWVQGLGVWLLTLVVAALMAWKLPMRRTIRADAERWRYRRGSTTGRRRLTATTPPSRSARALPEARDREGARGKGIPQPPGPER